MAQKQIDGGRNAPHRKAVTKKFRIDLVERLKALAAGWRPRTSVTAIMEMAFEDFLLKHEKRTEA
jgi:hypothetical protein